MRLFGAFACLTYLLCTTVVAQVVPRNPETLRAEALLVQLDQEARAALAEKLVAARESPGREFAPWYRRALVDGLKNESLTQLESRLGTGNIASMALGDTRKDLTYTPFAAPCRIIDTRLVAAPLPPGVPRGFKVAGGAGFDLQGGTIGGCGVPSGATAVFINFVAVSPSGAGNLRGSAYPDDVPTVGSILNYQALTPSLNIANGVLFPICDPAAPATDCGPADIKLLANVSSTHVVADVLGYAMKFPKEQVRTVVTQHTTYTNVVMGTTCTNMPDASHTVVAPVAGKIWVRANVMIRVVHVPGQFANSFLFVVALDDSTCLGTFTADSNFVSLSSPAGDYYLTFPLDKIVSVAAGSSTTLYVNGFKTGAGDSTGYLWDSTITAVFIPD